MPKVVAKPKIARSAEARAKSGDVGAKVELLFSWLGDVASGRAQLTFVQLVTTLAALIAVAAVAAGVYLLLRSKVVTLSPNDTATLKRVFYSGEPWLIECTSKTSAASPMVYAVESSLKGVQIGTLDCGALLPSGKSTFERFKLSPPSYGPVLLAAANTERPQIAPRNVLGETTLVPWVKGATKPKLYTPNSAAQFESQCVRKPWCLVVLTAMGRLNDAEKKALQVLADRERRLRIVKIDASKSSLLLDLPGGALPAPNTHQATLVLLKELEGGASDKAQPSTTTTAEDGGEEGGEEGVAEGGRPVVATHLSAGLTDPADTGSTILTALTSSEATPKGFSQLQKRPALRPRRVPVPSTPTYSTPTRQERKDEPKSKTLTDAELKALREERQRVIKEAELNRRAQMAEEEASAANIVEEAAEGADAEGSADASSLMDDAEEVASEAEDEVEQEDFD